MDGHEAAGSISASTPLSPRTISSTPLSSHTQIPTSSDASATPAGEVATSTLPAKGSSDAGRRAHSVRWWPASSMSVTIRSPCCPVRRTRYPPVQLAQLAGQTQASKIELAPSSITITRPDHPRSIAG